MDPAAPSKAKVKLHQPETKSSGKIAHLISEVKRKVLNGPAEWALRWFAA